MSAFTEAEVNYLLGARRLARLATVGPDGTPHVTPVGWRLDVERDVIEVSGRNFESTKKFRDVAATGRAAIVIDDVLPPWQPRAVTIRGSAAAIRGGQPHIRIRPERVVSWGID